MTAKWEQSTERSADIVRLVANNADQSSMIVSAVARRELEDLSANIGPFMTRTSELTSEASRVEYLVSTAEERGRGGFIQWVKVLFGAPSREECLAEALSFLDSVRLRMDSLALLSTDVQQGMDNIQTWADALMHAIPSLPEGEPREEAHGRIRDLKAMVANGHNTFSPYMNLTGKAEALQSWSLRAQNALES